MTIPQWLIDIIVLAVIFCGGVVAAGMSNDYRNIDNSKAWKFWWVGFVSISYVCMTVIGWLVMIIAVGPGFGASDMGGMLVATFSAAPASYSMGQICMGFAGIVSIVVGFVITVSISDP